MSERAEQSLASVLAASEAEMGDLVRPRQGSLGPLETFQRRVPLRWMSGAAALPRVRP